jgi:hypothetical protein
MGPLEVVEVSLDGSLIGQFTAADTGDGGYGWLPYDYVSAGLAEDWWTLIKAEWVDSGEFGL